MARKERNDVDYFPHPVNHGKKMFYIRNKFGNDGYSVWFMLLEELGKADYHYLDLSDNVQRMYLSSEFKVTDDVLIEIIETLVMFEEFDKDLWEEYQILFNQQFVESVEDAYRKRTSVCITLPVLRQMLSDKGSKKRDNYRKNRDNGRKIGGRSTQSKVKYSKEEESKVNDIPIGISSDGQATPPPSSAPVSKSYAERCRLFIEKFNEIRGSKYQVTGTVKDKLKLRLEKYKPQQILDALSNAMKDKHHIENSFKYLTPEFILRENKIEMYLHATPDTPKFEPQSGVNFINHQNRED